MSKKIIWRLFILELVTECSTVSKLILTDTVSKLILTSTPGED